MPFEAVQATTSEVRKEASHLRYQVFCGDNKVFSPTPDPGSLEVNVHDECPLSAVLLHEQMREMVGTTRLVPPRLGEPAFGCGGLRRGRTVS
jgi:hypothetical protein